MQRHDDRIRRGTRGRNERKELRCRNCTHVADFLSSSSFEQGKKANNPILERRGNALTGPFNASPAINRMPLLGGSEYFIVLCASIFIEPAAFNEFYPPPMFTISRNSGSARGMTDKRD